MATKSKSVDVDEELAPWENQSAGTVAQPEPAEGEVATFGPGMTQLIDYLAVRAQETDADTYAAMESVMREIFDAPDAASVLTEKMPIHGKEFVNKPFLCMGFTVREGEFEDGSPFYAVLDVRLNGGKESRVVTCGGWKVLAKLAKLDMIGEWPQVMQIIGKETKKGYTVLDIVRPETL